MNGTSKFRLVILMILVVCNEGACGTEYYSYRYTAVDTGRTSYVGEPARA